MLERTISERRGLRSPGELGFENGMGQRPAKTVAGVRGRIRERLKSVVREKKKGGFHKVLS